MQIWSLITFFLIFGVIIGGMYAFVHWDDIQFRFQRHCTQCGKEFITGESQVGGIEYAPRTGEPRQRYSKWRGCPDSGKYGRHDGDNYGREYWRPA